MRKFGALAARATFAECELFRPCGAVLDLSATCAPMGIMHIMSFTVDDAQELIGSGDYTQIQQVWIEKDGEVRISDPSGLRPSEAADTLYARSTTFAATATEANSYVGRQAANDPLWMSKVLDALLLAQTAFKAGKTPSISSEFWI